MDHLQSIIDTHPLRPQRDIDRITEAMAMVSACADVCHACADACLGEEMVKELVRCIRLNLDCADVCNATAGLLSRMTEPDGMVLRGQLETCITACRVCREECEKHAGMHEHCRVCADECARCEQACQSLLSTYTRMAA
jgi:hypothetical protein